MLFGAGNLMFPLMVGMVSGSNTLAGMIGFCCTAIILPLVGLIAMILFDGDYEAYFNRLGTTAGKAGLFICMLIVGPLIALPRIVTLSHIMTAPFLPTTFLQTITPLSSFAFAAIFLGVTFLLTYRENRIVDLLGYIISPLLLLSLTIIIIWGIATAQEPVPTALSALQAFKVNSIRGYETLDLLGTIFFASFVLHILKNTVTGSSGYNRKTLVLLGLKAGSIGVGLLGLVYAGMSILGMYHSHGLANANEGELFRHVSFQVIGTHGAGIIALAVLMACLSTSIALSAVLAEYTEITIFKKRYSYVTCLVLVMLATMPLSTLGLDSVRNITGGPIVYILYPMLITLTLCNIAYKLWNFKPVKLPVALTFVAAFIGYFWL